MTKSIKDKRKPAGKEEEFDFNASTLIGKDVKEGVLKIEDIQNGTKTQPLSTELAVGVTIRANEGGNPKKRDDSRGN